MTTKTRPGLDERTSTMLTVLVGRRWMAHLIYELIDGPKRFAQLSAIPGLTDRTLADRLSELRELGLVDRIVVEGPPLGTMYQLTDTGERLRGLGDLVAQLISDPVLMDLGAS